MIIKEIREQIAELQHKISEIQADCLHPVSARDEKDYGNTGHFDPADDKYWTDYHCGLCDKRWTVQKK